MMLTVAGVNSQHEIYEDLGLGAAAQLDPSFNVSNFDVLNMPTTDPTRRLAFECSLSGTLSMYGQAQHISSTQSPSVTGLTGSTSASPTTTASRRASAMAMAPITEQVTQNNDHLHLPDMSMVMDTSFSRPGTSYQRNCRIR